jgi:hypothetical protein
VEDRQPTYLGKKKPSNSIYGCLFLQVHLIANPLQKHIPTTLQKPIAKTHSNHIAKTHCKTHSNHIANPLQKHVPTTLQPLLLTKISTFQGPSTMSPNSQEFAT